MKELYVDVSLTQCRYANLLLLKEFSSDAKVEFARLEDYVKKLRRSNDGSIIILETEEDKPNRFRRIYVCFATVR